jgi:hypothetical protein
MSPKANVGFSQASGRRVAEDTLLDYMTTQVDCGSCGQPVPSGKACIVVNFHAQGWHQMFCPDHLPPNTRPHRGHT